MNNKDKKGVTPVHYIISSQLYSLKKLKLGVIGINKLGNELPMVSEQVNNILLPLTGEGYVIKW